VPAAARRNGAVDGAGAVAAAPVAPAPQAEGSATEPAPGAEPAAAPRTGRDALEGELPLFGTVIVIGTRASQQSGIERKKKAATAMDSMVADELGSFPDRNVGEAISRMSGVALDRGDFGEGVSVAVRGNAAELTRVELDGQAVQAAGGTDMNGGGGGRGVEFRQLSTDLIKSVDVVKGATADMTEGSLGGGIVIKTRTSFDFKRPFLSMRAAASQSSLNRKWEPDLNLIAANTFLDGRLGLLMNISTTTLRNEAHSSQVAASAQQGYYRLLDFDNSPEKTFSFLPSTMNLSDPSTTTPFLRTPLTGGRFLDSATPYELLTRSAAARSKADCRAAFPALTTAELASVTPSAQRGPATLQRGNELITCLNQWADYSPSLLRYFVKREIDRRQNLDLRADFKVDKSLSLYAKASYNNRRDDNSQLTHGLGNILLNQAATFGPAYTGPTSIDNVAALTRSAVPGSGYYLYDTPSSVSYTVYPGSVANVDPASVTVDKNHHLTRYTISDGQSSTDQLHDIASNTSQYVQAGGNWQRGPWSAEFFVGDARSEATRAIKRVEFKNYFGPATLAVQPNGMWTYSLPAGSAYNQADPAQYAVPFPASGNTAAAPLSATNTLAVPAATKDQQPLLTEAPTIFWNPVIRDTGERTARLDLAYAAPRADAFFTRVKGGINLRDTTGDSWDAYAGNSLGYTIKAAVGTFGQPGYVPAVFLPTAMLRGTVIGCVNTPGSLAPGGRACQYGYNPSPDPRRAREGQLVLSQQQFQNLIGQTLTGQATATSFFSGAAGHPASQVSNWTEIDVEKLYGLVNPPNLNFDCVKRCVASDGKVYDQPAQHVSERAQAAYLMTDFSLDRIPFTGQALPFGWELSGNLGYRYVRTRVHGSAMMNFSSIVKTAAFNASNPNAAAGIVTNTFARNTVIDDTSHDFLPIYNLALWLKPDQLVLRYNHAKAVARPPVGQLVPAGTCVYDQRIADDNPDAAQSCSGTIGNPALRAQMNVNQNLSAEFYPNKDTMFSVAVFRQEGRVGPALAQGVNGARLFEGSGELDPGTSKPLSDLKFNVTTYLNGPPTTRKGLEVGAKTAFTALPWLLRYTGFDANYTRLRSVTSTENVVDLLTGAPL
ncbi:MAG: TonB-dependent receptor plug domain-containing protein, partial [Massilia sp.]